MSRDAHEDAIANYGVGPLRDCCPPPPTSTRPNPAFAEARPPRYASSTFGLARRF
jgi:hypothetical protein